MTVDKRLILWLIVFVVGIWLFSKPRCNRGCKTVAEHLMTDGLDGFLATLIG
jgi:hypothetical protein